RRRNAARPPAGRVDTDNAPRRFAARPGRRIAATAGRWPRTTARSAAGCHRPWLPGGARRGLIAWLGSCRIRAWWVGNGAPTGTRTPVFAVRGRRPGPLDDGSGKQAWYYTRINLHTIAVIDNRTGQAHYLTAHHPARGTQYFAQPDFR